MTTCGRVCSASCVEVVTPASQVWQYVKNRYLCKSSLVSMKKTGICVKASLEHFGEFGKFSKLRLDHSIHIKYVFVHKTTYLIILACVYFGKYVLTTFAKHANVASTFVRWLAKLTNVTSTFVCWLAKLTNVASMFVCWLAKLGNVANV